MFNVNSTQLQYLTYTITDPIGEACLSIVPERGGIVTSWTVGDRELFYLDRERFTDPTLSVRGGIPVLFPICGNLPDNTYVYANKSYQLQQHGFARELPWQVVGQTASEDQGSVTVALMSNAATLAVYPWDFRLELEYIFGGDRLEIVQRVTNASVDETMPFSIGYHPYFAAADKGELDFQIPSLQYANKTGTEAYPFTGTFDFTAAEIDVVFSNLTEPQVKIIEPNGSYLQVGWNYPQGHVVFWTVADKDFYCIEPWTGLRNALNTGKDLIWLAAGETWTHSVEMIWR